MSMITRFAGSMARCIRRNLPTILTCLGAAGTVAGAIMAAKETPKVMQKCKELRIDAMNFEEDPPTTLDYAKATWRYYIPAATICASSIACVFGANVLNRHQQAAMASAYTMASGALMDYRGKVKELAEEGGDARIKEAIARDVYETQPVFFDIANGSFDDFEAATDDDEILFYDDFSKGYFYSTIKKVQRAEYHFNRNYTKRGYALLNEFYEFVGMVDPPLAGDVIGWSMDSGLMWVDFRHVKATMADGLECYIITTDIFPEEIC